MPLYRVVFADQGGARVQTHLRAPVAADHLTLAVQQLWGPQCYWAWVPGSDTEGRVYECYGAEPGPDDCPRTGRCTVQINPAHQRPRVS